MYRHWIVFALISLGLLPRTARADESAIRAALARPVGSPETTLAETQKFVERWIASLPKFESREAWESYATELRAKVLESVVYRGEAAKWRDAPLGVEWQETIDSGEGYVIKKLRYEALPGLWIPALLYEPKDVSGKRSVAMNVNGHDGDGKAADYKQLRCINQVKRGMIALNVEWLGMGQLAGADYSHARMNQLDLCGTSGLAPFYLSMKRGLDVLLAHENADPARVAVTGLSGGGWQTIVISALDTRVTLSNPVAGYSSYRTRATHFKDLGDSEQTPTDLAGIADYTHLTAMLAPRPALLTYCKQDNCCFEAPYALPPLLEAAEPIYALFDKSTNLDSHINSDPGTHNYGLDNRQAFYRKLGKHFFAGESFDASELPSEKELRTAAELKVELPENNATFHSLAMELAQDFPTGAALPTSANDVAAWREKAVGELRRLTRYVEYECAANESDVRQEADVKVASLTFKLGDDWTIPATLFAPAGATRTVLISGDSGRTALASKVASAVESGYRVIAFDPFYFGECRFVERDYLFALLVHSTGERVIGQQVAQAAAIARWAKAKYEQPVTIAADGPRGCLYSLIAAALEPNAIGAAELHRSYGSLKEVIEQNLAVTAAPELFCFGLLEKFDVLQIAAMAAPRPVRFLESTERVAAELAPLADWYALQGAEHSPLE